MTEPKTFYEFFAGGGMARLGLGSDWKCLIANDICPKKAAAYRENFPPAEEFKLGDIGGLRPEDVPGRADLAWASFPCQDLSLAGERRGLAGERSGTFWKFHGLMAALAAEKRLPRLIVVENVVGAITSNGGADLEAILRAFADLGYRAGPLVMDAALFLPQSRPRLFVVAVGPDSVVPSELIGSGPKPVWHTRAIETAYDRLPDDLREHWIWWEIPEPAARAKDLTDIAESKPTGVKWHTPEETERLLNMMSPVNRAKVEQEQAKKRRGGRRTISVGTVYKRTRPQGENGEKVQRAEVRFDGIGGCLRTPAGGSSRQTIIVVDKMMVKTRLLSPREAARLMGVPDDYKLPKNYNDAYHLMGDGVAVPVVSWLEQHVLSRIEAQEKNQLESVA